MTKLEALKEKHAELRKQIVEESKAFFKEESRVLFDKYPAMESFSWRQYTPHFNDGDACVFNVYSDAEINGVDEYDDDEKKLPEKTYHAVSKFVDAIDSDTMKEMFGDHVKVIATRDGVTIEEYEHD